MLTLPELRLVATEEAPPVPPASSCRHCGGTGWVRYAVEYGHPDFGKARSCRVATVPIVSRWSAAGRFRTFQQMTPQRPIWRRSSHTTTHRAK